VPVPVGEGRQLGGGGLGGVEAGDRVDDFLVEELAVAVKAIAADAGDLGGVREAQAGRGAGDPGRAAHDAAVAVVEFPVAGLAGAAGLDRVEDGALERRLVALDGQEVVRVPAPGPWPGRRWTPPWRCRHGRHRR
jgi:hypothetical protein